jgi:hypothetical protein
MSSPVQPPADDASGYVFPTWRDYLKDAHEGVSWAYERRRRAFSAAHGAGLSYREIGEATGLSAAAVGKALGKQPRATLDSVASS